jgi:hypothetical protein
MSDTPETDAAWKEGSAIREWACRKLERERDDARTERDILVGELEKVYKERDEARESLGEEMKFHHRTHTELVHTQCKILDMQIGRDEARAVAGELADIASKHLSFLLAVTPTKANETHEKDTMKVIASLKRWKKLQK